MFAIWWRKPWILPLNLQCKYSPEKMDAFPKHISHTSRISRISRISWNWHKLFSKFARRKDFFLGPEMEEWLSGLLNLANWVVSFVKHSPLTTYHFLCSEQQDNQSLAKRKPEILASCVVLICINKDSWRRIIIIGCSAGDWIAGLVEGSGCSSILIYSIMSRDMGPPSSYLPFLPFISEDANATPFVYFPYLFQNKYNKIGALDFIWSSLSNSFIHF